MSNKYDHSSLSIIDAVEALTGLVDSDIDQESPLSVPEIEIEGKSIKSRNIEWLVPENMDKTIDTVKEIFQVVLNYFKSWYKKEEHYSTSQKTVDGIKAIMVLVGEAAKKFDRYRAVIEGDRADNSITHLPEYRKLQEFYRKRIDKQISESVLSRWIFGLAKSSFWGHQASEIKKRKVETSHHVFIDLDAVKKDEDYELLLLRKEDGSRFFNPRLLRNVQLVCDFGQTLEMPAEEKTSLIKTEEYEEKIFFYAAEDILKSVWPTFNSFFECLPNGIEHEFIDSLLKAITALMMITHIHTKKKESWEKNSRDYFSDFQFYLRVALKSAEYQKLIAYPEKEQNPALQAGLICAHALCRSLFKNISALQRLTPEIDHVIHEARIRLKKPELQTLTGQAFWQKMATDYAALVNLLKSDPLGPIHKSLHYLEQGITVAFDSIVQGNIPEMLYKVNWDGNDYNLIKVPSPTRQAVINKAAVTDEFKAFLASYHSDKMKHLLINLQDRTSWKDQSRCSVLEHLQQIPFYGDAIVVTTSPIDTVFYHQLPPYHHLHYTDSFLEKFHENMHSEESGYYLPETLNQNVNDGFEESCLKAVHELFFEKKASLNREQRIQFMMLFDLFFHLKSLEIVSPHTFSFSCKDALDIGASRGALLFIFCKLLNQEVMTEADTEYLNLILYGPALLIRERVILPESFNRLVNTIKAIEEARQRLGYSEFKREISRLFGPLFKKSLDTLQAITPSQGASIWDLSAAA